MRHICLLLLIGCLSVRVLAQSGTIVPSVRLIESGNPYPAILLPPSGLTAPTTFTLPATSGTLLISSSTASPTFGGLTVTGGPITLDPGVGNNITFNNIPADAGTTVFLTLDGSGRLRTNTVSTASSWLQAGTSITAPGTGGGQQYLGTSNAQDLVVAANATERMRITSTGVVSLPNVSVPQGSRFSINGTYTGALTADATQININNTFNGAGAAFTTRGLSVTSVLTNAIGSLTPQGAYIRTTVQNSSGTIADAAGLYVDFSRTSGGGSATISRYTGLRARFINNNANINGMGLFVDGPNNTGLLPAASSFTAIHVDTVPSSGSATRRVFVYNGAAGEQVLIGANGALALGTLTPASSSRLEVSGTAGTPNVRFSSLGGTAKAVVPVGYDRFVMANNTGDLDNVSPTAVAALINAQPLDGELTGLAALSGTGFLTQTSAGTFAQRSITGSGNVVVSNGNGVGGDPTISLTGIIPYGNGGTGATSYTTNGVLYAGASSFASTTAGTTGQVLVGNTGGAPTWSSTIPSGITVSFADVSAGTNANALLVSGSLAPSGGTITANRFISATSASDAVDLDATSAEVSGTLPVGNGGTGSTSFTGDRVIVSNNAGTALTALATANNALLVTNGTGVPSISTTFPSGVTVPFSQVSGGTNTSVLTVIGGGSLSPAAGGVITANALSGLAGFGIVAQTSSGNFFPRTITGGGPISVIHGSGVTGDPTIALTGTVPVANGGTGSTSFTGDRVIVSNNAGTALTALATANNALLVTNGTGVPSISTTFPSGVAVPFSQVSGGTNTSVLTVIGGGSLSPAAGGVITANALSGLAGFGIVAQTSPGNFFPRTITGSGPISVSNGTGVSGDPTIALSGTVGVANGGTGATTLTANGVLLGNGTGAITATAVGTTGQILVGNTGGAPTWSSTIPSGITVSFADVSAGTNANALLVSGSLAPSGGTITANRFVSATSASNAVDLDATSAEVSGTLPVGNGGTGLTTAPINSMLYASAANTYSSLTPGNNQVLTSNGTGVPTWISGSVVPAGLTANAPVRTDGSGVLTTGSTNLGTEVTGVLPVTNGGTGLATAPINSLLYASGLNVYSSLAAGANGTVLTIVAGVPTWQAPVAGSFGSITSGTNTSAAMVVGAGASITPASTADNITATRFTGSGSTSSAVDLGTSEVSGTLGIANGGTGATSAGAALTNLGAQPSSTNLTAISSLSTLGIVVRDAATPTYVTRQIAVSTPITITNGDGVSGNPTIGLGTVPVGNGGTGATTLTANGVLLGNGVSAIGATAVGTTGQVLVGNTAAAPTWTSTPVVSAATLTNTTNQLVLGTTNTTTISAAAPAASRTYGIPDAGANADFVLTQGSQSISGTKTIDGSLVPGTGTIRANQYVGSGSTTNAVDLSTTEVDGTLPIARGGTGVTTTPTNGQVLIGNGTGYVASTITAGSGITVTNGSGSITIAATGSGNFTIVRNATTDATNNDVTYQNATELSAAVSANTTYTFEAFLRTQNTTGGHNTDIAVSFPSGTATYSIERVDDSGGENVVIDAVSPAAITNVNTDDVVRVFRLQGVVYVGGTAGTLQIQYRRTTAGAASSQILDGSYLSVGR